MDQETEKTIDDYIKEAREKVEEELNKFRELQEAGRRKTYIQAGLILGATFVVSVGIWKVMKHYSN